ncbi:unnamed protein product [Calypogeia fissa]
MAMTTTVAARATSVSSKFSLTRACARNELSGYDQQERRNCLSSGLGPSTFRVKKQLLGDGSALCQLQHGEKRQRRGLGKIEMTLIDNRPAILGPSLGKTMTKTLAYELVQGTMARRWTDTMDKTQPDTPTAVLVHGILGARKSWASFARRLAVEFPTWQFLMVDLRCHGESTFLSKQGPHSVLSAARDVLQLVGELKLTPRLLIGHSFGGKVVMSMVDQAVKPLARPVRVWVLDATPGRVYTGGHDADHPEELIAALQEMPAVVPSRKAVADALARKGFSDKIAEWMVTNLRPVKGTTGFYWVFDLEGVSDMYRSYTETNLWPLVEGVPEGVHIDFLRAERSLHTWYHADVERIRTAERIASREGAGVKMHLLEECGHWVHTDNPDGLFRILTSSDSFATPTFATPRIPLILP